MEKIKMNPETAKKLGVVIGAVAGFAGVVAMMLLTGKEDATVVVSDFASEIISE